MITAAQRHVLYNKPVQPNVWHPRYRDEDALRDWIENGTEEHAWLSLDGTFVQVNCDIADDGPVPYGVREFIRIDVEAPAPYTGGRPLVYRWHVAIDDLGRVLSTDARLIPVPVEYRQPIAMNAREQERYN
jgi:hypothetical protein